MWFRRLAGFAGLCVLAFLLILSIGLAIYIARLPDLQVWHTAILDAEFTEDSPVSTFKEYLALEDRLFAQLDEKVYKKTAPATPDTVNRYRRGSLADPARWPTNWNRSFLLEAEHPRRVVLLLHGLTDAPYSLRHLALRLHRSGATVLGLRIPGHGTAPSGLTTVTWQDMAAAVKLAAKHLNKLGGGQPIDIVGYSNGAALALHYTLQSIGNPSLPHVRHLVLLSPQIAISPAAGLAVWQARLGHLLGLRKLEWNAVHLEYEPFKYGSFAVNAAALAHRITLENQRRLRELAEAGKLGQMPPILSFSSVIDATVEAPAVITELFNRLPAGGHELVLFDFNRQAGVEPLLNWNPDPMLDAVRRASPRHYGLTLVTNSDRQSLAVMAAHWPPDQQSATRTPLGLSWPKEVYSLSHVALPFASDDSVYGGFPAGPGPGIHLGNLAWRGERGALRISASSQLRLRWNPFYSWMEDRAVGFLELN
ncbi:alpha/beta hydrolase [Microbulbifer hainanensis]|uniref:alpha/beta hydrolase n=1 Tax=Microbulbifer hainanensis TaxID=2735675 RepID=UPI001868AE30|nr:alpha/beta fold hydrolase [Microbulbifer hainanensis]